MISSMSAIVQARTLVARVGFYIERNAAEVDISAAGGEGLDDRRGLRRHTACRESFRGAGPRHRAVRSAGVSVFCESLSASARPAAGLPSLPANPPLNLTAQHSNFCLLLR